jgi:hypothetical protein
LQLYIIKVDIFLKKKQFKEALVEM